jgi:hypothetical protein
VETLRFLQIVGLGHYLDLAAVQFRQTFVASNCCERITCEEDFGFQGMGDVLMRGKLVSVHGGKKLNNGVK